MNTWRRLLAQDSSKSTEAVAQRCSVKKVFLEISQNLRENTCTRASIYKVATLWKRDSGTGVLCEFCEISKNTFFYRTPLVAAFESNGFYQRRETSKNSEIRLIRTSFPAIHKHKQFLQNAPSKMLDWVIHPWIWMMDRNSW